MSFHHAHIKYLAEIHPQVGTLYYLGGEAEENDGRLTIGKMYYLRTSSYSPSPDVDRVSVWLCNDRYSGFPWRTIGRVNRDNFGTLADLRSKKINQIMEY